MTPKRPHGFLDTHAFTGGELPQNYILENGLSEFDVMTLAGHSKFETTCRFYLAIIKDLIDRARVISEQTKDEDLLRTHQRAINAKGLANVTACQSLSCNNEADGARTHNLRIDNPML
jgi:hypothetical protein